MKEQIKKQKWYENNKDLATKEIFNIFWFGIWMFSLIISSKHIAYFGTWEGYFLAFFSAGMLALQQMWQWKMIKHLRKKENKK